LRKDVRQRSQRSFLLHIDQGIDIVERGLPKYHTV
jgi:hypothetical protein